MEEKRPPLQKKKPDTLDPAPKGVERRKISRKEYLQAAQDDIDPMKYAGEGWFATEEYATPEGIDNPYTAGEVGREEEYYPGKLTKGRRYTP